MISCNTLYVRPTKCNKYKIIVIPKNIYFQVIHLKWWYLISAFIFPNLKFAADFKWNSVSLWIIYWTIFIMQCFISDNCELIWNSWAHANKSFSVKVVVRIINTAASKIKFNFRDGVEVYGNDVGLNPKESRPLLLQVPPGYNPGDSYKLRIEGYHRF